MSATPLSYDAKHKAKGSDKFARLSGIRVTVEQPKDLIHIKPRIKLGDMTAVNKLKSLLESQDLVTVCQEASCPNLPECFAKGTATFMIMGDKCTRRCSFCDVAHGRPDALDPEEPNRLAKTIQKMQLKYVVVTSVNRDDLKDGGGQHFASCIKSIRSANPNIKIEILVPDFRKRQKAALDALSHHLPDVFNHNIETIPRLYRTARAGAGYDVSLNLLREFKNQFGNIPTKSGLMLGLGETIEEVKVVMDDLRAHDVDRITIGQYLQPSAHHYPVQHYATQDTFDALAQYANDIGFEHVASGPLVRSSYHADKQDNGEKVG